MKNIEKKILVGGIALLGLAYWLNPNGNGKVIQNEKEKICNESIKASYKKYSSGKELLILDDGNGAIFADFKGDTLYNFYGISTKKEGNLMLDKYMNRDSLYSIRNNLKE